MTLVEVGDGVDDFGRSGREVVLDFGAQGRLIELHGQQVVSLSLLDGARDGGIAGDGINGNDRPLQAPLGGKALQQDRDGGDFVGFVADRLLAEHQTGGRGEGGNQVQRRLASVTVVAAP